MELYLLADKHGTLVDTTTGKAKEVWEFMLIQTPGMQRIKTTKRYQQILASYLRAIKAGEFHQVVWITPSTELAIRLGSIIKSIETVPIAGQKIAIDPARHHLHLHFTDYSNWPNLVGGK